MKENDNIQEPREQEKSRNFLTNMEGEGVGRIISSFENPAATMRYTQTAESIDALEGKPKEIENIIAHDVEIHDSDSGEDRRVVRIVLVSPAPGSKAYAAVSDGVFNSVQMLTDSKMYGLPPFDPPIKVELVKVKTRKGFSTSRLVPLVE